MNTHTPFSSLSSTSTPRKVFLFSGHMIDQPQRAKPRFPADKEPLAARALSHLLDRLEAGPADLAVCSAACGGDLLFAEAARARGMAVEIYLPLQADAFIAASVAFAGEHWVRRFYAATTRAQLHSMPEELGPLPAGHDPFERVNLWMLDSARRHGGGKVEFVCLWNLQGGDGPGGTQHLAETVQRTGGRSHILATTDLWPAEAGQRGQARDAAQFSRRTDNPVAA